MYEQTLSLNTTFGSLADPTRRDILRRVATAELTIGQIAESYELSFQAVSKHLKTLERAKLIIKRRQGKQQYVQLAPYAFADATEYLDWYRELWETRFDRLEEYLKNNE
jgi:DNA-binding transcriptional ArsR family regulator